MGLQERLNEYRGIAGARVGVRGADTGDGVRLWGRCEVTGDVRIGDRARLIGRPNTIRLLAGPNGLL